MSVHDITSPRMGVLAFGISDAKVVAHLRSLADDIESGAVILIDMAFVNTASVDDFATSALTVKVVARNPDA